MVAIASVLLGPYRGWCWVRNAHHACPASPVNAETAISSRLAIRVGSQLAASSLRAAALPTYSRSSRYPSMASIVLTAR